MSYKGDFAVDSTVYHKFTTNDADGGRIEPSDAFEAADLLIYKNGSATERDSSAGVTMTSPFDSKVGLQHISIDLSDDSDSGFYAAGNDYQVVLYPDETVDSQNVSKVLFDFSIENRGVAGAKAVWDRVLTGATHNIVNSAGRKLSDIASDIILTGTSPNTGGTANTAIRIELDGDASAVDGSYDPSIICIIAGTGKDQCREIYEYDGTNKYAYINRDWKVTPDDTSQYIIVGHSGDTHVNEGLATGGGANTITLNSLASSVDGTYNGQTVFISAGTGADQGLRIIAYNGTTKVATVSRNWETQPANGASIYAVLPHTNKLNDISVADIIGTAMTEDYGALGAERTLSQAVYEIMALLKEKGVVTTTLTTKKLDQLTTAKTYTLDDATTPSSITEAS